VSEAPAGRRGILRRDEEQSAGDGGGEVEDSIVVAGRVTDEHVGEHPIGDLWRTGVCNVEGPELAATDVPNGMLSRRIFSSLPSGSVMTLSATCELLGLRSSGNSMSASLLRPMTFS